MPFSAPSASSRPPDGVVSYALDDASHGYRSVEVEGSSGRWHRAARPLGRSTRALLTISTLAFVPLSTAKKAEIDKTSWGELLSAIGPVCGNSAHRGACLQPLLPSDTDAPCSSQPLYLAREVVGQAATDSVWQLFPFRMLKGKPEVDQLMLNLIGPAESSDSGVVLLIDSTTATNVHCGGKRYAGQ
jgi:hypothetical protein